MKVYIVTGFDLGWDNVVGVFDCATISKQELENRFPVVAYYIDIQTVETKLDSE